MGLDIVELVMAVEEKFGISIDNEEAAKALTVGDLKRLVRAKLDVADAPNLLGKPRTAKWSEEEVSSLLRELIIKQLGVRDFDDSSRFVDDLRVD
jgi:acyl carrier protein